MLLGVETDDERGDVDDLLADATTTSLAHFSPITSTIDVTDVALLDQDTGVVDGLGEAELVDAGLETALQEILDLEGKHVIELHAGLVEHTDADETANEGIAFEETLGVLLVEGEKLTVEEHVSRCHSVALVRCQNQLDWIFTYRAARRILERVSWTRHTSRLLRRPYSPTIFNSESL